MPVLSVAEAAAELGVSPRRVRQLLADGVLRGQRVGRVWVIERQQLRLVDQNRRESGRPWSAASAWAALALADSEDAALLPVERSRARKHLAAGLDQIVGRLTVRAERRWFYGHPAVLGRLAGHSGIVRAGMSAAADHQVDLVVSDGFEGYVRAGDLDGFAEGLGLDEQSPRPNILLRVVDDAVWPFRPDQRAAGRAVVAVDLLESDNPRAQRAGLELMERS